MKFKKLVSIFLSCALMAGMMAGCAGDTGTSSAPATDGQVSEAATGDDTTAGGNHKIYLITMDQMDQHWVNVDAGCKKAVEELGNVDYTWLAPDVKDDAKQIECINNAVAGGAEAILLAANGPDAVTAALEEADAAGVKIVYVDSAADFPGVQTLATDNKAAGTIAGEEMIKALEANGITEGKIGIVNVNAATASTVAREEGFRAAFEGTKPSTATATQQSPRTSLQTTSRRAAWVSSARTKAPPSAPEMPFRKLARLLSASASISPTQSSTSSRTVTSSAPWRRTRT